jgi:hypothetical protein
VKGVMVLIAGLTEVMRSDTTAGANGASGLSGG